MTEQAPSPQHALLACLDALEAELKAVEDLEPMFMSVADKKAALVRSVAIRSRMDALYLRLLGSADDVAEQDGARDAAAWVALHTRQDRQQCRRDLRLAKALGESCAVVARALTDGEIHLEQARTVVEAVHAVATLPGDVDEEIVRAAEECLVTEAGAHDPRNLRIMGRRVLDVIAPEVAEDAERRALEREEGYASSVTKLTTRSFGDGTSQVVWRGADAVKDRLLTYLSSLANPRRKDGSEAKNPDDRRPYPQKLGHAFVTLLETLDPQRLPIHGGDATTVLVTMDADTLTERLDASGVAMIGDQPVSASEARRLACQAGIIPMILGSASVVLDMGRKRRLYTGSQRRAQAKRQSTCGGEGCDIPSAWCEAHHGNGRWVDGAGTDAKDCVLLCAFHHHRAHDPRYDLTRMPDGSVRFSRRT